MRSYFLTLLLTAALLGLSMTARADGTPIGPILRALAQDDADTQALITQLGASGDPRALRLLVALDHEQLKLDPRGGAFVEVQQRWLDAFRLTPSAPSPSAVKPTLNNMARRAIASAIARLRLSSADRSERLIAAQEIAKEPPDGADAFLEKQAREASDPEIKDLLENGLAKLQLTHTDANRRLRAVQLLSRHTDTNLRAAFEAMTQKGLAGAYNEPDPRVRAAAAAALGRIKSKLFFINIVANLFYGLSLGSILLLAALGLAITFGLMRVINMAHGEMLMLGAYATFAVQNFFLAQAPGYQDYYLILAVPVAFAVCTLIGVLLERTVIRFLYGRPLETLLATWGLSLILIQTVRVVFGAQNVAVANPSWLSGGFELLPNVVLPYSRIAVIVFVVVVVSAVYFALQKTNLGLKVRAVTQNRTMAAAVGISTRRVDMWTFGLGSGVAGLGGVALSQLGNVGPELGQNFIVDSFMVVVVGGVGSVLGTVCGALGLGLLNKFLEPVAGAVLGKILLLAFLILFIQKRPQGIFALKGRAAEA